MEDSVKDEIEYPFSKVRVYFSLFAGILTIILSIPILFEISGYSVVLLFLLLSALMVIISFRLKVYTLRRMQRVEEGTYPFAVGRSALFDRNFVMLILFAAFILLLPVVLAFFDAAYLAFLGMISFVTGFCLSEPLLYWYCTTKF